jgi:hypothetical protein
MHPWQVYWIVSHELLPIVYLSSILVQL